MRTKKNTVKIVGTVSRFCSICGKGNNSLLLSNGIIICKKCMGE